MATASLAGISAHHSILTIRPNTETLGWANMPGKMAVATFKTLYYMYTGWSLRHGAPNDVIYDI